MPETIQLGPLGFEVAACIAKLLFEDFSSHNTYQSRRLSFQHQMNLRCVVLTPDGKQVAVVIQSTNIKRTNVRQRHVPGKYPVVPWRVFSLIAVVLGVDGEPGEVFLIEPEFLCRLFQQVEEGGGTRNGIREDVATYLESRAPQQLLAGWPVDRA